MATTMLEDDFKSSHQDVGSIPNESDSSENLKSKKVSDPSSSLKNPNASPTKHKSVDFATLPPTKRVRLDTLRLTAKQVVEGAFRCHFGVLHKQFWIFSTPSYTCSRFFHDSR
jgi:hypothetical protein